MTTITESTPTPTRRRAFTVWYKDLARWDPESFNQIDWHWPPDYMLPLGSLLTKRREKVDRASTPFASLTPITIHFNGSISRRHVKSGREYSMELFRALPGDLVVAKIDLKNGAVGVLPDDFLNAVVTGHFAVYRIDTSRVDPAFLTSLFQTRAFKAHLWRNKVGSEGRKEVKLDFFENEPIPVPPLSVQRRIVSAAAKARDQAARLCAEADEREATIAATVFRRLGLRAPEKSENLPRHLTVWWTQIQRWGLRANQLACSALDLTSGSYPVRDVGSMVDLVQYGTSKKANSQTIGTPVLRINNIKRGVVDASDIKHVQLSLRELDAVKLLDGDVLVIRTSGSRDLVGTCAVFHEPADYVFASYLIRLQVRNDIVLPDYLAFVLNSSIGRRQVDAVSRKIMQCNVNTEELRNLRIPLPPLAVQRSLLEEIVSGRLAAEALRARAKAVQAAAAVDVERLVLGVSNP